MPDCFQLHPNQSKPNGMGQIQWMRDAFLRLCYAGGGGLGVGSGGGVTTVGRTGGRPCRSGWHQCLNGVVWLWPTLGSVCALSSTGDSCSKEDGLFAVRIFRPAIIVHGSSFAFR